MPIKYWNGSSWVTLSESDIQSFDGSAFGAVNNVSHYDGTSWSSLFSGGGSDEPPDGISGLVSRFTFEDTSNTATLSDVWGGGDGSNSGGDGLYVSDSSVEGSYVGDYAGASTTGAGESVTGAFTVTMFVNRASTSRRDDFAQTRAAESNDGLIRANTDALEVGVPGQTNYVSSLSVPTGWRLIGIAYDGSGNATIHVDGGNEDASGGLMDFGNLDIAAGGNGFGGLVDDVRVYDRQLSDSELNTIAANV